MMVKDKPVTTKPDSPPRRVTNPETVIKNWVGTVDNLDSIRVTNVYDDRYRVDVFVRHWSDDSLYRKLKIGESYFVKVVDNTVVDLTWRNHEKAS